MLNFYITYIVFKHFIIGVSFHLLLSWLVISYYSLSTNITVDFKLILFAHIIFVRLIFIGKTLLYFFIDMKLIKPTTIIITTIQKMSYGSFLFITRYLDEFTV